MTEICLFRLFAIPSTLVIQRKKQNIKSQSKISDIAEELEFKYVEFTGKAVLRQENLRAGQFRYAQHQLTHKRQRLSHKIQAGIIFVPEHWDLFGLGDFSLGIYDPNPVRFRLCRGTDQTSMILPPAGRSLSLNPKSVSMRRVASIFGGQPILSPRNLVAS